MHSKIERLGTPKSFKHTYLRNNFNLSYDKTVSYFRVILFLKILGINHTQKTPYCCDSATALLIFQNPTATFRFT